MIYANTKVLKSSLSGVQRYLNAIISTGRFKSIDISSSGIVGHLEEQLILPFKLKTNDVLWSPSNTGPIYCRCPHVVTIHDFATLDHPEWTNWKFNLFYRFILPRVAKSCNSIIAISDYTKSRILHHVNIDENKVHVIKNGVDERFFENDESIDIEFIFRKYKIPSRRYILSVSSIEPRKNLSTLLKAWGKAVPLLDDDLHLVLVGKPNHKIFADAGLNHIPPRVHFTGFVDDDDLVTIYQNALLFTYVSLYEGFGLPPLEAMAAGVPVITSNTTSIPEVVSDKAITINPLSVEDIADNIICLSKNDGLLRRMREDGINHARGFSWKNTAESTYQLLKSFE